MAQTFTVDRQRRREFTRRAIAASPKSRTLHIARNVSVLFVIPAYFLVSGCLRANLRPWEYDALGEFGVSLTGSLAFAVIAFALHWTSLSVGSPLTVNRDPQTVILDEDSLIYLYRTAGDRYMGVGGWHHVLLDLKDPSSKIGWDEDAQVIGLRGGLYFQYALGTHPQDTITTANMQRIDLCEIPNVFQPDLHEALRALTGE